MRTEYNQLKIMILNSHIHPYQHHKISLSPPAPHTPLMFLICLSVWNNLQQKWNDKPKHQNSGREQEKENDFLRLSTSIMQQHSSNLYKHQLQITINKFTRVLDLIRCPKFHLFISRPSELEIQKAKKNQLCTKMKTMNSSAFNKQENSTVR